jgi:hypothetical protein
MPYFYKYRCSRTFSLVRLYYQESVKMFINAKINTFRDLVLVIGFLVIFHPVFSSDAVTETDEIALYKAIDFGVYERPQFDIFQRAFAGYLALQQSGKLSSKKILTIMDFRKSANEKRMWIIDLEKRKVLFHSLAAHGRNTGNLFAKKFSNTPNSNQSSLGFYVTGQKYIGKHGISLKLHGVEKGINDLAEARAIVMHGANYVSESYIKKYGRLGRSFGCPAVPMGLHKEIIPLLAGGTCLFIFYPDAQYLADSKFNNLENIESDSNISGR